MQALRRWLRYRDMVEELTDAPTSAIAELGIARTAIRDYAWYNAAISVERSATADDPHGKARPSPLDVVRR